MNDSIYIRACYFLGGSCFTSSIMAIGDRRGGIAVALFIIAACNIIAAEVSARAGGE